MTKGTLLSTNIGKNGGVLSFCQFCQNAKKVIRMHFWQFCHIVRIPLENDPKTLKNCKRKGWVRKSVTKLINNIYIYTYICFYLLYYRALRGVDSFGRVLSEGVTKV